MEYNERKADSNRSFRIKQGYKPVLNVDNDELGLARTEEGAVLVLKRCLSYLGWKGREVEKEYGPIKVTDHGAYFQI